MYKLEMVVVVEEDVFGFEVAVGDAFGMQVLEDVDNFSGVILSQRIGEDLYS